MSKYDQQYDQPPPYGIHPSVHPSAQPMAPSPMIAVPVNYGPEPQMCVCPHCRANIKTDLRTEATTKTHLSALLLCLVFCWPCVCLPYCMDSCQNRNHYCPGCGAYLGSYQA